jgi:hypothetical protein
MGNIFTRWRKPRLNLETYGEKKQRTWKIPTFVKKPFEGKPKTEYYRGEGEKVTPAAVRLEQKEKKLSEKEAQLETKIVSKEKQIGLKEKGLEKKLAYLKEKQRYKSMKKEYFALAHPRVVATREEAKKLGVSAGRFSSKAGGYVVSYVGGKMREKPRVVYRARKAAHHKIKHHRRARYKWVKVRI